MNRRSNTTVAQRMGLNLGKHPFKQKAAEGLGELATADIERLTVEVEGRKRPDVGSSVSFLALALSSLALVAVTAPMVFEGSFFIASWLMLGFWAAVGSVVYTLFDPPHVRRAWVSLLALEREKRVCEPLKAARRRRCWSRRWQQHFARSRV